MFKHVEKLSEFAPVMIYQFLLRSDGRSCFPYASDAIKTIYRVTAEEVREDASKVIANLHPDDHDDVMASIKRSGDDLTLWNYEYRVKFDDGVVRWLQGHSMPEKLEDGSVLWHGIITDISERKHNEKLEIFRSDTLEVLAKGESLAKVLETLVLGVEEVDSNMLCSVLLLDGEHLRECVAPHLPDFYNAAINGVHIGMGVGSCGTAAFTGERVIVEDIQTHPYWTSYKKLAEEAGLAACWSQPIRTLDHQVLGTFAIYYRQPQTPDEANLRLIEQAANLASIAIVGKRTTDALSLSEEKHRQLIESSHDIIYSLDAQGIFTFVSPSLRVTLGYTISQVQDHSFTQFVHPCNLETCQMALHAIFATGESLKNIEYRIKHRDGSWQWHSSSMAAIKDVKGNVISAMGIAKDITEQKKMAEQIHTMAFYDVLTGLPNRRMLSERLSDMMASSKRSGLYCALMFLDLDNFKLLNDTRGHSMGDALLIDVTKRLCVSLREVDTVARFGGDEFVVMIGELNTNKDDAIKIAKDVAEKIRQSVAEPYHLSVSKNGESSSIEHRCTVSIGVVMFTNHEVSEEELLRLGDKAMYQAKCAGRNAIRFY